MEDLATRIADRIKRGKENAEAALPEGEKPDADYVAQVTNHTEVRRAPASKAADAKGVEAEWKANA